MTQNSKRQSRLVRYQLRTLILIVAVAAVALAIARPLFDWLDSTPLPQAVAQFNDQISDTVKVDSTLLDENAVLQAIQSTLSLGNTPEHVTTLLKKIQSSHRLPRNTFFDHDVYYKGSTPGEPPIECLGVTLVLPSGPDERFRLPVIEIENGFLVE
ncbi:MAG TPA: hypothetical protein DDX19_24665 [Rhodopirellula baltica]|nr:hypothetical protein [Rhodopirellula baltica]